MTFMFIPYKPMKIKFRMIIIVELWPIKFVMHYPYQDCQHRKDMSKSH